MLSHNPGFPFNVNFNFAVESVYVALNSDSGNVIPPITGNFNLLDATNFLLLDGTNLLLL